VLLEQCCQNQLMQAAFVAWQGREVCDGLSAAQAVTTAEAAASCQEGAWRCEGQSVYDSAGRSHDARHSHRHTAGLTCAIAPLFLSCFCRFVWKRLKCARRCHTHSDRRPWRLHSAYLHAVCFASTSCITSRQVAHQVSSVAWMLT